MELPYISHDRSGVDYAQPPADTGAVEARKALLSFMRGTEVTIPDLQSLMEHWPRGLHPELQMLHEELTKALRA